MSVEVVSPPHRRPEDTEALMRQVYDERIDLTNCEHEPLERIRVVQPFAALVVVEPDSLELRYVSENLAELTGIPWERALGRAMTEVFPVDVVAFVRRIAGRASFEEVNPLLVGFEVDGRQVARHLSLARVGDALGLEIEPIQEEHEGSAFQYRLGQAVQRIQNLDDSLALFAETTRILREVSGYDRVMIYRFDEEYNGEVIAESTVEGIDSYRGLRYPASDIPAQARRLYLDNHVRILADVAAAPTWIRAADGAPAEVDLTHVACRGTSPIHVEYLVNMGVTATMSIAIVVEDRLWGLFALHHGRPRHLGFRMRAFMKFLGQVFSGHLAVHAAGEYRRRVLDAQVRRARLGDEISLADDIGLALTTGELTALQMVDAVEGAAVCIDDQLRTVGKTPNVDEVRALVEHIVQRSDDPLIFHTDRLPEACPELDGLGDGAKGVLVTWLERERNEYIVWFRGERVREVAWGGKPVKEHIDLAAGGTRLAPRKSFARYVELVSGRSRPWTDEDEDAALALRAHINDVVLRRYHHVRRVNTELELAYKEMESFSYTVSHDLRAPLRGIAGYAEVLMEDYGDRLDDEAREMLDSIRANTARMNTFINELLELSRIGIAVLERQEIDLAVLAQERYRELVPAYADRQIRFTVDDDLPPVYADYRMISIAIGNLVGNAMKYSYNADPAVISLAARRNDAGEVVYSVADNGVGFRQEYAERSFEMFTRLHHDSEIEGTGVGLALVKRVFDKHGGRVWAESAPGEGATFSFVIPREQ